MPSLGSIITNLKSDEWELRVDGLKALTKLGEEARTPDQRQQLAKLLKQEGIGKLVTDQLRNLRSVVAAAACRCATALATGLGSDGRGLADEHWTATLLGVASGGAPKVVQEAATQALSAIVDAAAPIGNAALFSRLCQTAETAKAPPARKHAMDLAARALGRWRPDSNWAQAASVVEKRARDADGSARAAARGLWLALRHAGFARQAQDCLDASLNQSIVESVTDKKSFYEEDHARPGPGQYTIPTTMGPYPDSKMRSVVVPVFTEGTRETKPPKRTPGPSDYDGRSTMGRQPISTKRSEPGFRFGAAERPIGKSI